MIKFILLYFYQGWNNVFYMLISADLFAAIVSIYKFFFFENRGKTHYTHPLPRIREQIAQF